MQQCQLRILVSLAVLLTALQLATGWPIEQIGKHEAGEGTALYAFVKSNGTKDTDCNNEKRLFTTNAGGRITHITFNHTGSVDCGIPIPINGGPGATFVVIEHISKRYNCPFNYTLNVLAKWDR